MTKEKGVPLKVPPHAVNNSFRIIPYKLFVPEEVEAHIESIINLTFDQFNLEEPGSQYTFCTTVSMIVIKMLHEARYERYKFMAFTDLIENVHQGMASIARFFWNPITDNYAFVKVNRDNYIVTVIVFALYFD